MNDELKSVVSRVHASAREYIETVESVADLQREVFLSRVSNCLAELYCAALRLPTVEPETADIDETRLGVEAQASLYKLLQEKIGSPDSYWAIFDSSEQSAPVQASLALDVFEIYEYLKHDLDLIDRGIAETDWLWELRFSFRSHWGRHLLGALTAIHHMSIE